MKKKLKVSERLYPNPVVLISASFKGKDNITTACWVGTVCSKPPLISISLRPSRYSHQLICKSNEFVINVPSDKLIDVCEYCGKHSGTNIDKFDKLNLNREKIEIVKTPLIKECPINIVCLNRKFINLGSHNLFIGEVVGLYCDENIVTEEGKIDVKNANLISHSSSNYFKNIFFKGI